MARQDVTPITDDTLIDDVNQLAVNDQEMNIRMGVVEASTLTMDNGSVMLSDFINGLIAAYATANGGIGGGGGSGGATVPDPPTNVVVDASIPNDASISFTPGANGGAGITMFTATCSNGTTAQSPTSPIDMPQLPSGDYTVTVHASNIVGDSAESAASDDFQVSDPAPTAPTSPTGVSATGGGGYADVAWVPVADDGGSPVLFYTVGPIGPSETPVQTSDGNATSLRVYLSTPGDYTFVVSATNAVDTSDESDPSLSTTVSAAPTKPSPVTSVVATPGILSASISAVPGSNNGSAITNYHVVSSTGATADGTSFPIPITDTAGTGRTYTVTATNAVGTSDPATSSAVTIAAATAPTAAPTISTITTAILHATVNFSLVADANNGGSPITGYLVTSSSGASNTGTVSPVVVTESAGGTFTYTARAVNAVGNGTVSAGVQATVPALVNDLPQGYADTTIGAASFKTGANSGPAPTLSSSTGIVRTTGGSSIKMVMGGTQAGYAGPNVTVPVTATSTVSGLVSMYAATATGAQVACQVSFFSMPGGVLTYVGNITGTAVTATHAGWVDLVVTGTVPSGATLAEVQGNVVAPPQPAVGDQWYLAQFEIANGTVATWAPGA